MNRIAACLFIVSTCLGMSSCDNPKLAELLSSNKRFPIKRTLTDRQGRKMKASITGRTESTLTITRMDDRKSFVYPISRLSDKDQAFARSLPIGSTKSNIRSSDNTLSSSSRTSHTIALNNREIEDLKRQYKELNTELQRYEYGTMKNRSTWRRMMEIQAKIDGLRSENDRLKRQ